MSRPHQRLVRAEEKAKPKLRTSILVLFVAFHAPLCVAFKLVPYLSTVHALISLAIALMLVIMRYPMGWVVAGCAYLVGSETIWRVTDTLVPYEFGKYSAVLIAVTAMILRRQRATSQLPILYMALLVPGALLTVFAVSSFDQLRQILSAELSGPVAYAACSLFLLGQTMSRDDVLRCLAAMLAPIAGVAALALFGICTTEIEFGASSK